MQGLIKIGIFICAILFSIHTDACADPVLSSYDLNDAVPQPDSIRTNYLENALDNYKEELKNRPTDSIEIFRNIAIIYAELKRPEEASYFTERYIKNSADISILDKDSYNQISDTKEYEFLKNKYLTNINVLTFIYFCHRIFLCNYYKF